MGDATRDVGGGAGAPPDRSAAPGWPDGVSRRRFVGAGGLGAAGALVGIAAACSLPGQAPAPAQAQAGGDVDYVRTRFYPWVDVTAHGARGDGQADDTEAIQTSLNILALGGARGGGTIYVPKGRYKVTSTLRIGTGVHMVGDSGIGGQVGGPDNNRGVSEIFASGFEGPVIENMDTAGGNDGISLRRLRIVGPQGTATSTFGAALSFRATVGSCAGIVVESCAVWRGGRAGIELHRTSVSWIRSCFIGGNGAMACGILMSDAPDNHIVENQITTGCVTPGRGGHGIDMRFCNHNIVANNQVFWADHGIRAESSRCAFAGNRIDMNLRCGLAIVGGSGSNTITGNVFHTNGRGGGSLSPAAGVHLSDAANHNVLSGNSFSDWTAWRPGPEEGPGGHQRFGVAVTGTARNNAITGNVFVDQVAGGISQAAGSGPNVVSGNAGQA
jgi:parallel beta-helix repeat protein